MAVVKIIINADDLGRSDGINDAIFSALSENLITSATMMATGPSIESAMATAALYRHASFGVHLNLTTHRPITGAADLAPLLDESGCFHRDAAWRANWDASLRRAVIREWSAQVERILDGGVDVSHLDSHHHVHTIPALFGPLKAVQRRFRLRKVRGTWTLYERARAPSPLLMLKKRAWMVALRTVYRTTTTDRFSDFLMFLKALDEGSLDSARWPECVELMVHPIGVPELDGEEATALRSEWRRRLPVPATLISYRML